MTFIHKVASDWERLLKELIFSEILVRTATRPRATASMLLYTPSNPLKLPLPHSFIFEMSPLNILRCLFVLFCFPLSAW